MDIKQQRKLRDQRYQEIRILAREYLRRLELAQKSETKVPDNVTWHRHFFADENEDIKGRYDACRSETGIFSVYSAEEQDFVCNAKDENWAIKIAQALAAAYGRRNAN